MKGLVQTALLVLTNASSWTECANDCIEKDSNYFCQNIDSIFSQDEPGACCKGDT
jgi:hypothetical protein